MISPADRQRLQQYKLLLGRYLGDPARLRPAVTAAVTLLALAGIYWPLSQRIDSARGELRSQQQRLEAITDVENLRKQAETYRQRLDGGSETNHWVQHILAAQREAQVRLRDMESREPRKVGPYRAVTLAVEVEGTFSNLRRFVEWLENSPRLLRIESVRFEKQTDSILMRIVVLGLVQQKAKK